MLYVLFYRPEHFHTETKFVVSLSNLGVLLSSCTECDGKTTYRLRTQQGAFCEFEMRCVKCGTDRIWSTTPRVGSTPLINTLLSAACLFTGSSPSKMTRIFQVASIQCPSYRTFFAHQHDYLHGVSMDRQAAVFLCSGSFFIYTCLMTMPHA